MRMIDADALEIALGRLWRATAPRDTDDKETSLERAAMCRGIDDCIGIAQRAPTVGGWISVQDRIPEEHPSIFAGLYGTEKWVKGMWRNESDRVLVTIVFPNGMRTVDKGRLQDGTWKTGVSPILPQEVTHWAMCPEPPELPEVET